MKRTLIYLDAGNDCLFSEERTRKQIEEIKIKAANLGHIGYLSGYRYYDGKSETVIVFFKDKPTVWEIEKRRQNGFRAAKWFYINPKM